MCPFEKKEKEFFWTNNFFFHEHNILSKEQLLISFLCIVTQKKFQGDQKIFEKVFFLKLLSKF